MEVSGQVHKQAALLRENHPRYPLSSRLGAPPTQLVWAPRKKENLLSLLGIEIKILGCPGKIVMENV